MKINGKKELLFLITIMLGICMMFSFSYAFLYDNKKESDVIKYEKTTISGVIKINIFDINNKPQKSNEALGSYINRFDFKVKNDLEEETKIDLAIETYHLSTLKFDDIYFAIIESKEESLPEVKKLTNKKYKLSSENKNSIFNKYKAITIDTFLLKDNVILNPNEEKEFYLYMWVNENAIINEKDIFEGIIVAN